MVCSIFGDQEPVIPSSEAVSTEHGNPPGRAPTSSYSKVTNYHKYVKLGQPGLWN